MTSSATKIYTKTGDKGKTSLIGGTRVDKSDSRLETYGTLDELNSFLGLIIAETMSNRQSQDLSDASHNQLNSELESICTELFEIQKNLFCIGGVIACEDDKILSALPMIKETASTHLEGLMDQYSKDLAQLKHFVLPGGSKMASLCHVARTVCRRAERNFVRSSGKSSDDDLELSSSISSLPPAFYSLIIIYLNRLSDYLFVLARHCNRLAGIAEPIWEGKQKK